MEKSSQDQDPGEELCDGCGGCGIVVADEISHIGRNAPTLVSANMKVFIEKCDQCTGQVSDLEAAKLVAGALNSDIILVRVPGFSFKPAVMAWLEPVEKLIETWNEKKMSILDVAVEDKKREESFQ